MEIGKPEQLGREQIRPEHTYRRRETVAIIEKILQDNCLELDELMEWTGCEFTADEVVDW
jgi:hypothetical protein